MHSKYYVITVISFLRSICNKKGVLSHSETQCHEKRFEGSLQGDKGCDI